MEGNNFQKWVEKLSRNSDTVYSDLVFYATKHLKETKGLLNIHKSRKDNQISNKNREIGNKEYGKKKLSNALEYYNRAIAYADHNEPTECLALGYANRSAVLFELGYFNECESVSIKMRMHSAHSEGCLVLSTIADSASVRILTQIFFMYLKESENSTNHLKNLTKIQDGARLKIWRNIT